MKQVSHKISRRIPIIELEIDKQTSTIISKKLYNSMLNVSWFSVFHQLDIGTTELSKWKDLTLKG